MKTTLMLPDALMREIKLRAVHEGRKLKDVVADLLRKGLDSPEAAGEEVQRLERDVDSGLPVIRCRKPARLAPERVAEVLLDQEVTWQHGAGR